MEVAWQYRCVPSESFKCDKWNSRSRQVDTKIMYPCWNCIFYKIDVFHPCEYYNCSDFSILNGYTGYLKVVSLNNHTRAIFEPPTQVMVSRYIGFTFYFNLSRKQNGSMMGWPRKRIMKKLSQNIKELVWIGLKMIFENNAAVNHNFLDSLGIVHPSKGDWREREIEGVKGTPKHIDNILEVVLYMFAF